MRLALCLVVVAVAAMPVAAQDSVGARMQTWSTYLGVECAHCHVAGQWADESKPAFDFARRMSRMVDGLNAGPARELGGVTCWTCHRGQARPARLPRPLWEPIRDRIVAEQAAHKEHALAMAVYSSSLGVDCQHCHEADQWATSSKRPFAMVARMNAIFEEIPKHFDETRQPSTQCYMCHQGKTKPERTPAQ